MADRQRPTGEENRVTRRRLLATLGVATATGLAGCGGGSDGGGAGTDDVPTMGGTPTPPPEMEQTPTEASMETPTEATPESGPGPGSDSDSTGPLTCTDFAGEYTAFDPGERRLIFRGEYPAAYQEPSYDPSSVTMRTAFGSDAPRAEIQFGQTFESPSTPIPERDGYEPFTETTFNGQTRAVGLATETPNIQGIAVQAEALVSGTYGGSEERFRIRILHNVLPENDTDTEACRSALAEAVRHAFETLEANPDTTVAEML